MLLSFRRGRRSTLASGAALGLLLSASALLAGCAITTLPVHYILPNGYRGVFGIMLNQADGVGVPFKQGRYIVVVPSDGMLRLRGKGPFYGWHSVTAAFADATPIPEEYSDPAPADGVVAHRPLFSRTDGRITIIWDLIGTKAEWQAAHLADPRALRPGPIVTK